MKRIDSLSWLVAVRFTLIYMALLMTTNSLQCQQLADSSSATHSTAGIAKAATAEREQKPLTLRQRFTDYRQSTFHPFALITPAVGAGFNQLNNFPSEWKQGGEGYGKRLLSGYGGLVVNNTITFGVAALDGEDTRYVLSTYPRRDILHRSGYAIGHTFTSGKKNGGRSFAWSRMIAAAGAGFVANEWYPERRQSLHNAAHLGTFNLAAALAGNFLREFVRPHLEFGSGHKQ